MAKIYMYAHGGSGNHGCEAIVRSTCDMLNNPLWDEILLISSKTEEDIKYGLDKICTIKKDVQSYSKITLPFIRAYIALKLKNDYVPLDKLNYKKTIDMVHKNDIVLSIGGDNYCYADVNKYIMLSVQRLKETDELLKKFRWILENEELIKKQLNSKIPEVIKRALTAKEYVERLL